MEMHLPSRAPRQAWSDQLIPEHLEEEAENGSARFRHRAMSWFGKVNLRGDMSKCRNARLAL
eukprot:755877-Hanusia_phi.AAC.2